MTQNFFVAAILLVALVVVAAPNVDARRLRIAPRPVVRDGPPKCDRCTDAVTKIRNAVSNPNTTAEIKQALELICQFKQNDQARKQCRDQLDAEVDQVKANITAELAQPLAFCTKHDLCEGQLCDKCVEGVDKISAQLFAPGGLRERIYDAAEKYFCKHLPYFIENICASQVQSAVWQLFGNLQQKLSNPQKVCQDLKICNQTEVDLHSSYKVFEKVITAPREDIPCAMCEGLGLAIFIALGEGKTQPEIEQRLNVICQKLPIDQLKTACKKFLDEKLDEFIPAVKQSNGNIPQACHSINLCVPSNTEANLEAAFLEEFMKTNSPRQQDIPCAICEGAGLAIFIALEEGKTQAEIEQRLTAVCQKLPIDALKTACTNFLDENLDKFIPAVKASNGNIPQACRTINICTMSIQEDQRTEVEAVFVNELVAATAVREDIPCAMCEGLGLAIFIALDEGKTQAEIEQRLNVICQKLPIDQLKTACKKFLDENLDKFIPAVKQSNGNIPQACRTINLCMNQLDEEQIVAASVSKITSSDPADVKAGVPCAFCEGVGLAIFIALLEGKTPQQITERLETICDRLPGKIQTLCKNFVKTDLAIFIPLIKASNGNVLAACHHIGMCI